MFPIILLFEISYSFFASEITNIYFFLQNWGDFTDMSQAVILYVFSICLVLLICWCGSQLTQQVRQNGLLLSLLFALLAHYIDNMY